MQAYVVGTEVVGMGCWQPDHNKDNRVPRGNITDHCEERVCTGDQASKQARRQKVLVVGLLSPL